MSDERRTRKIRILCNVSLLACASIGAAAQAQTVTAPPKSEEDTREILVTGTRVQREGFSAPTPVSVASREDIDTLAPANVADYINRLPAFSNSVSPRSSLGSGGIVAGGNYLNTRALGPSRTLVLLDGRRLPPSTITGLVNINLIPTALIERVEVVTGGASAAWGSDAVAGVVNFILDKKFTGIKGSLQAGIAEAGDAPTQNVELAFGKEFADGRGRIVLSAEYSNIGKAGPVGSRSWFRGNKVIANPAFVAGNGQPARIVLPNVGISNATDGGLITTGVLRGTQFGPGGATSPFDFGFVSGLQSVNGTAEDTSRNLQLQNEVELINLFGRAAFDVTDQVGVFAEIAYADQTVFARNVPYNRFGNITMSSDNAFLPTALAAQLVAARQPTFRMGRINEDLGSAATHLTAKLFRVDAGLNGKFSDNWTWDLYYQYGRDDFINRSINNANIANYNLAIDAVRNAATGAIVCRSTLTDPSNGCVPLNIFGSYSFSPAAKAYVLGSAIQNVQIEQQRVAFDVNGELFSNWKEPISVAFGAETRKTSYAADADAVSLVNGWWTGNFKPSGGNIKVMEGYVEAVAPLIRGKPFFDSLVLNGAARITDYSSSGSVFTWKLGATWDLVKGFRLRGTRSVDIRAPNLNELYQSGGSSTGQIFDPFTNATVPFISVLRGNLNLRPERANTFSVGGVFEPSFLRSFQLSVDYFDIAIGSAITVLPAVTTLQRCFAGETALCSAIERNPAGVITQIFVRPENVQSESTSGIDIEASYRTSLDRLIAGWNANLNLRVLSTHVFRRTVQAGTATLNYAGALADASAVPDWRLFASAVYQHGPFQGTVTARHIGKGVLRNEWGPADIANNNVPGITYFDLGLSWKVRAAGRQIEFFTVVENLFDQAPPATPITTSPVHLNTGTNQVLYDTIGRQYRAGVRFRL
jgi:iron complex outermembrane recepter protein